MQLTVSVDPDVMFKDYAYFSSYAPTVVENARELATSLVAERGLGPSDLAMEIASNDGYLLEHYRALGVPVLGIDPAENVAEVAVAQGIPTVCDFFGTRVAEELRASGQRASVLHANNVLAHVPDITGVLQGIGTRARATTAAS